MNSLPLNLNAILENGLLPEAAHGTQTAFADRMKNLRPLGKVAAVPERVIYPMGTGQASMDWPFPYLFAGARRMIELGATTLHTVNVDTWVKTLITTYDAQTPASVLAIPRGECWHTIAYHDTWIASNKEALVFSLPSNPSGKVLVTTTVTANALCGHPETARILVAGLSGDWFSGEEWGLVFDCWRELNSTFAHDAMTFDDTWAVWGPGGGGDDDIPFYHFLVTLGVFGSAAFDKYFSHIITMVEKGEIGMAPVAGIGEVRAAGAHGEGFIIYGANGTTRLMGENLRPRRGPAFGIADRGTLAVTPARHVYADSGNYLWSWPIGADMPKLLNFRSHINALPCFRYAFGSIGTGNGEFAGPLYVASACQSIFVSDVANGRVQRLNKHGEFLSEITGIDSPGAIAVYEDEIYVAETGQYRIRVFNLAGVLQRTFGAFGTGNGQFLGISGLCVHEAEVFVVDHNLCRVQVFSTAGVYNRKWGTSGSGAGQLSEPRGIAVHNNLVYIADSLNNRINLYSFTGISYGAIGSAGTGDGEFNRVVALGFYEDELFAVDHQNNRIQVFDLDGQYDRQFGEFGVLDGEFNTPWSLCFTEGLLYIGDSSNHRIQGLDTGLVTACVFSYDEVYDEVWIATNHGAHILTRNDKLGGPMDASPTNLFRFENETLVGAALNQCGEEADVLIRTGVLSFSSGDTKHLENLHVEAEGLSDAVVRCLWRMHRESFFRLNTWFPLNRQHVGFPRTSFVDAHFELKGTVEWRRGGRISAWDGYFQYEGRNYTPGMRNVRT